MKQLKRLTSVLLVLGIVLGLMPLSAFAAEPENAVATTFTVTEQVTGGKNTYTYTLLDDNTVELTGFDTTAEAANAVIPSPVQGHRVTSIGNGVFSCCRKLKTVKLPDSVTSVGAGSFYECTKLEKVYLGNSVVSIGVNAFAYCTILDSVTLPDSIVSIGTGAFGCCTALKTVNLGNSVDSIGEHAFSGCTALKTVNLGNSVDSIGEYAFAYCTILESVTIPSSVQTIGENAFYFGPSGEGKQLEKLHYTGTQEQWDKLAKENDFINQNILLTNSENFDCAHTVSFDCGGRAEGSTQPVQYGEKVRQPADPKAEGYQFDGWYTQENGGVPFDFNQEITEDVKVYAHWSVKPTPTPTPTPTPNPDPTPTPTPTPDPDTDTAKKYTLTEKDGTLVRVTVVENGTTVDITKNVELKKEGTTQIGKIPAGAMVTVAANAAPEGMVFAQWNISDPELMGDPDVAHTSQTMRFPMPTADVTVEAMYESAENARETELLGSAAMIGAVGISAVVLAYQAHQLGTELYLKYLLPSGAAIPQNRIQLAELLWKNAGEPVPDVNAMYEDIGLNEEAAQQAAQWAVENELMELPDEEHTEQFKPDEQISYGEAIRAWKKAQQLKTAE